MTAAAASIWRVFDTPAKTLALGGLTLPLVLGPERAVRLAAAIGRGFGSSFINRKRLQRGVEHLREAFPDLDEVEHRRLALSAYEHIFKLGAEFSFAPRLLTEDAWPRHIALTDVSAPVRALLGSRPVTLITGHVGNWELIGYALALMGFPIHAVYRPIDNRALDGWMRETRRRRGLTLVSKWGAVRDIPKAMAMGNAAGFVADQNGGDRGVFVPYFGRLCSTYKSVGLMAMQFESPIVCGFARRLKPGEAVPPGTRAQPGFGGPGSLRYVAEIVDAFGPEDWNRYPDPLFYLTARYRRAMEVMIRRAPEQYLWMHRVWRARPPHERLDKPFPAALKEKLAWLPWMTTEELERIIERSERDRVEYRTNPPKKRKK
ncbi:MAG: lysophospholipid acyltransferase family protein [Planctomycetes bacterium]|nr:lysophospholipid acyltransferase family protein [Planctomycetota bacterium]